MQGHLWATEPMLAEQQSQSTGSRTLLPGLAQLCLWIAPAEWQHQNDSLLKMHLFITSWGRQTTCPVYREFRFFSPLLSLPLPSATSNQTSYLGNKSDILQNLMTNGTGRKKNSLCLLTATKKKNHINQRREGRAQGGGTDKAEKHASARAHRQVPMGLLTTQEDVDFNSQVETTIGMN